MNRRRRPRCQRRGGAPRGNKNARRHSPWVDYPLDTRENLDRLIQDTIKGAWTGQLGTRQASAINGSVRLLLESRGWIQRTPLQIIQAQAVLPPKTFTLHEIADALEALPLEAQDEFFRKLREQRVKAGLAPSEG